MVAQCAMWPGQDILTQFRVDKYFLKLKYFPMPPGQLRGGLVGAVAGDVRWPGQVPASWPPPMVEQLRWRPGSSSQHPAVLSHTTGWQAEQSSHWCKAMVHNICWKYLRHTVQCTPVPGCPSLYGPTPAWSVYGERRRSLHTVSQAQNCQQQ